MVKTRVPTHRYSDPLDCVWLAAAERLGLRVERSAEVYASTDGRGVLEIGAADTLDPDDCVAQMIFHEICHSLVEGEASFGSIDWGLDNLGDGDVWREHATLRVQVVLTQPYGLERVLAPTTDFRAFYDGQLEAPLEPAGAPDVELARIALKRASGAPWAPHLQTALGATRDIARAVVVAGGHVQQPTDLAPLLWALTRCDAGDGP